MLRKQDEGLEEDVEDLADERVLPVEGLVEPLDDELADEELHLVVVRVLGQQLPREEHLADALEGDLAQDSMLDHEVVLEDDTLELEGWGGGLLRRVYTMDDEGIY